MTIETRTYINSHGKAPRGRGMWAFIFRTVEGNETWFCPTPGTFAECSKRAKAEVSARIKAGRGGIFGIEAAP